MKPKKLNNKLNLSKTTIANLSADEEGKIRGGYYYTACGEDCYSWGLVKTCATRPQVCGYTPDYTYLSCPFEPKG